MIKIVKSSLAQLCFRYVSEYGLRYCDGKKTHFGYDFSGSSNMAELKLLLGRTCLVRRLKSEVLTELPAKQRQMVILDPGAVKSKSKEMKASVHAFGSFAAFSIIDCRSIRCHIISFNNVTLDSPKIT